MLRNTFRHIPGIGPKAEQRLWAEGVLSWEDAARAARLPLSRRQSETVRRHVDESLLHLQSAGAAYFEERLPAALHWRMFPEFADCAAYFDIETTGLGTAGDHITTIVLHHAGAVRHYVYGQNLEDFVEDIEDAGLLVTYNGKCFDVPFVRHCLGAPMRQGHIDLRYVLHNLGLRGGLKGVERQLGLDRGDLADVDGYFAVLLWQDYFAHGNERALETLLAYNTLDVVDLPTLMAIAYNRSLVATPFATTHLLGVPEPPQPQFRPDLPTIQRIRRRMGWA